MTLHVCVAGYIIGVGASVLYYIRSNKNKVSEERLDNRTIMFMSIFSWLNFIFIAVVIAFILIGRGVYLIPDTLKEIIGSWRLHKAKKRYKNKTR